MVDYEADDKEDRREKKSSRIAPRQKTGRLGKAKGSANNAEKQKRKQMNGNNNSDGASDGDRKINPLFCGEL